MKLRNNLHIALLTTISLVLFLVEGIIPARSIHVMQNWQEPSLSPWFILDEESGVQTFSAFQFYDSDLKCFPSE